MDSAGQREACKIMQPRGFGSTCAFHAKICHLSTASCVNCIPENRNAEVDLTRTRSFEKGYLARSNSVSLNRLPRQACLGHLETMTKLQTIFFSLSLSLSLALFLSHSLSPDPQEDVKSRKPQFWTLILLRCRLRNLKVDPTFWIRPGAGGLFFGAGSKGRRQVLLWHRFWSPKVDLLFGPTEGSQ